MSEDKRLSALQNTLNTVAGVVEKLATQMQELNKQISQLAGNSKKLGTAQQKAAKETEKSAKETQKSADATKNANKESKGLFSTLGKNLKTIISFYGAYQVLNLALTAFRDITVGSIKRAIEFEKALSDLRAIAGLTAEEVNRLEKVVFQVAGSTSLTTTEVVELQKSLAKLGSSVTDIENLTEPIAILSQSLGEDPGGVASSLKKALNQFQATSEEADRFGNIFVGAVNETALSLDDLGTSLSYVGPLASQLGVSFEETSALLGILADNGFKASKAGTGLRNFFTVAAKDGRPFNEFLEDVAGRGLNAAESFEIFGKVGASQALVLSENIDRFKQLSLELSDNTRLMTANAVQMDNTQGQLDLLSSAYNKLSTRIGEFFIQNKTIIGITQLLDVKTAALAETYSILATASEKTKNNIDDLTESFRRVSDETDNMNISSLEQAFNIVEQSGKFSEKSIYLFQEYLKIYRFLGDTELEAVNAIEDNQGRAVRRIAATVKLLIEQSKERADQLDKEEIALRANDDATKDYALSVSNLQSLAAADIDIYDDKISLLSDLKRELKENEDAQEEIRKKGLQASAQEIVSYQVTEKRIAILRELINTLNGVENSEESLKNKREQANKEEQKRLRAEFNDYLERIKETEDAIENLRVEISESAFPSQIDLLNGFFGGAEDIIEDAKKRFGPDSKFVKDLIKALKDTADEIAVQLPKQAGDIIDLPSKVIGSVIEGDVPEMELKKPAEIIVKTFYDKVKEAFEGLDWGEVIIEAVDTATEAVGQFNDTALENTKSRAEQELDIIRSRYDIEEQILKSQLDNQLITESQFRKKQTDLRKSQIAEENSIDKQIFDAERKRDRQNASTDYLEAIASIIPTLIAYDKTADPVSILTKAAITGALATAAYGAEISAINQRKFFPKKFAEGGMVSGPSHSDGGVPFTVQGQGGYEMEGGEYIVNKRATAMHRDLLDRINNSYRTRPQVGRMKFADGGLVTSPMNESVDYLKAIAEATTSTAIGVSKPVRAYVSDKDLRSNATERRIRDRNDRL